MSWGKILKSHDLRDLVKFLRMNSSTLSEKDIRLEPVVIGKDTTIDQLLEFYMGKNTPDRQNFILENLVVEDTDIERKELKEEEVITETEG